MPVLAEFLRKTRQDNSSVYTHVLTYRSKSYHICQAALNRRFEAGDFTVQLGVNQMRPFFLL